MKKVYHLLRDCYYRILIVIVDLLFKDFDDKAIVCMSMYNNCYGGNPKAFSDYLLYRYDGKYKIFWVFSHGVDFEVDSRIKKIKAFSFLYFKIMKRCKFIISDYRLSRYSLPFKTSKQVYVQTWHGTALKRIEKDVEHTLSSSYIKEAKWDSENIDVFLAGSSFMKEVYEKSFWYNGEIHLLGTPRCDCFFKNDATRIQKIKQKLNIEAHKKIVMFAPTFRKGMEANLKVCNINVNKILELLTTKFGGEWVMVTRFHPVMVFHSSFKKLIPSSKNIIDATLYPDMQDLLQISDCLITDYSSSFFDYSLTLKPCFLYGIDWQTYNRGFLFDLDKLPYAFARTEDEFYTNIASYNVEQSIKRILDFNKQIGMAEYGNSCEKLSALLNL